MLLLYVQWSQKQYLTAWDRLSQCFSQVGESKTGGHRWIISPFFHGDNSSMGYMQNEVRYKVIKPHKPNDSCFLFSVMWDGLSVVKHKTFYFNVKICPKIGWTFD